jgi:hypothetical protein
MSHDPKDWRWFDVAHRESVCLDCIDRTLAMLNHTIADRELEELNEARVRASIENGDAAALLRSIGIG